MAIIIGSKKKAYGKNSKNDIDILIKKIREKLEDSPVAILPFIESCTRNAHLIQSSAKQLIINYVCNVDYGRGDSMNGTPTVSWQRLFAIDRVKLKVIKSSVKS